MIGLEDRQQLAHWITAAWRSGARLRQACAVAGIDVRTLQRWKACDGLHRGDRRPEAVRPLPAHALTPQAREAVLQVANESRFADMPPARIVPMLADEGTYLASVSSFSRILRLAGQNRHRGRSRPPQAGRAPQTHVATAPGQFWCWDMTYLPTHVAGQWFYLYLILDLYSRKVVGWEVHAEDEGDHAARLVHRTPLAEGIALKDQDQRPVLHGDNGSTIRATSVLAMLHWLDVEPSYSRPRVSDDNAFVENLFRTTNYRHEFPEKGFRTLEDTRHWASSFVHWYNFKHRHSGIRYVSPGQRHRGKDRQILAQRHAVYLQARERHPAPWSRQTLNWSPIEAVALNPERDDVVSLAMQPASDKRAAVA